MILVDRRAPTAPPRVEEGIWSQTWTFEGQLPGPDPLSEAFLAAMSSTLSNYFREAAIEGALRSIGYRLLARLESDGFSARGTWHEALVAVVDYLATRGVARSVRLELRNDCFVLSALDLVSAVDPGTTVPLSPLPAAALAAVSRAGIKVAIVECALREDGAFSMECRLVG